ncbi:hypothetical protein EVAR_34468_1 [Eumeta japonica]|uniref:Uncharacterized protein n=1 Tax=Eumeta variegata TaxID=151549 RepID=A0A4C1WY52_EUMVA|nr:hypothetical protein EVAR_34468_1 [Eumeta japonica]
MTKLRCCHTVYTDAVRAVRSAAAGRARRRGRISLETIGANANVNYQEWKVVVCKERSVSSRDRLAVLAVPLRRKHHSAPHYILQCRAPKAKRRGRRGDGVDELVASENIPARSSTTDAASDNDGRGRRPPPLAPRLPTPRAARAARG